MFKANIIYMKRQKFLIFLSAIVFSFLLVVGFNPIIQNQAALSSPKTELTLSAAVSMSDALSSIKPLYVNANPNIEIIYNFGSSGSLQQQIENGAPVDIFISAATKQMDALQQKNLIINETRRNLLRNKIVLIVPRDNKTITSFRDLATNKAKTVALGEPASVPAGQYAQEVLTYLGILDRVKPKAVYGKDVRQVLNYVVTGNVDAGIV
ncbi:MAG: molybdate ABC transporter substrate-binding protein, partial [Microcystaceae cyanobacterium]